MHKHHIKHRASEAMLNVHIYGTTHSGYEGGTISRSLDVVGLLAEQDKVVPESSVFIHFFARYQT